MLCGAALCVAGQHVRLSVVAWGTLWLVAGGVAGKQQIAQAATCLLPTIVQQMVYSRYHAAAGTGRCEPFLMRLCPCSLTVLEVPLPPASSFPQA
jgi:hypothetical protein